MKPLLILALGTAMAAAACGTTAVDATDSPLASGNGLAAGTASQVVVANTVTAPRPRYRDVTIPAGTMLPLSLTSSMASDTSAVEDAVSAQLTRAITIDGFDVLPAGAEVNGHVTEVDGSGRVKGRARIAFRFTSLRAAEKRYVVESSPLAHLAPATKGEDATKIGVGAGAGAIIGGILGGKDGAAKGAAVGGGAGTGVVLATKGQEMRLGPGADVSTQLTAPLTVRIRVS